ncbi:MAG: hypothetical protein ACT4NY_19325 [Pseudonocardiales bacterium]
MLGSVRRELRVATWLSGAGIPAVRLLVREPIVVGELVVSFWDYLSEVEATDLLTLAGFLRQLHTTWVPSWIRCGRSSVSPSGSNPLRSWLRLIVGSCGPGMLISLLSGSGCGLIWVQRF